MENTESPNVIKIGTNPFVTLALFLAVIAGVVTAGTHFSHRHSAARELEAVMENSATAAGTMVTVTSIEH